MIFKGLAVAALLLAFAHAPSSSTRQAAPVPIQNPAPAASAPPTPGAAAPSAKSACPGGNCNEWPLQVKVANPPAMVPLWPWYARISWVANLVLVVLGYVGIMLALSVLKKIERQTKASEQAANAAAESAQAALSHAQAIVNAERAWVLVVAEPSRTLKNGFVVLATNRGRTPARIISAVETTECAQDEAHLPAPPQYPEEKPGSPLVRTVLLPGESVEITTFSRDDVANLCPSEDQLKRIERWEEKIFLYGRLTYEDLITPRGDPVHQTGWCFWYIHGRQKSGLVAAGSRDYNLHT
jgi:hypothetical protein